ncbi:hypothetical protein BJ138DRAFT_1168313 [Hygrophoropsis aurantiaca]|uniref:Uncharacterized protein n=1 Tax=Hygrophoropsis aurantiaca TaxID=72124 RepID=A0ACB7ZSI8_9AGAM|nr:hypothetical protein BJ138DRAFT_1168313 [Hygrophoropsis aurantiaca]
MSVYVCFRFHEASLDNRKSAFQEYVIATAALVSKIPPNITFEQAGAVSLCLATATIPLYSKQPIGLGFQAPWDGGRGTYEGQPIFVIGGASSVGQYVIQFARLSGFSPILTTASSHNHSLLKSLGATHVLDRNLTFSDISEEISKIIDAPLKVIYDAVMTPATSQGGYDILSAGGHIVTALGAAIKTQEGDDKNIVGVFGDFHAPQNFALGTVIVSHLTKLLADGDIVPNAVEVVTGGFNGVVNGIDRLRKREVSAKKLIIRPQDTV